MSVKSWEQAFSKGWATYPRWQRDCERSLHLSKTEKAATPVLKVASEAKRGCGTGGGGIKMGGEGLSFTPKQAKGENGLKHNFDMLSILCNGQNGAKQILAGKRKPSTPKQLQKCEFCPSLLINITLDLN